VTGKASDSRLAKDSRAAREGKEDP
jgi:hypothetical protein